MDSPDKKVNGCETEDRLSILEGDSQYQVRHRVFDGVESLKATMPSQFPRDPFTGEEGTDVQYRSMKWW